MEEKDERRYLAMQENQQQAWESMCGRCGACCGLKDDPCENLFQADDGKYACKVYDNRLAMQKTVSGKKFRCIPIRFILHTSWPGDECCGYKKALKL